MIKFLLAFFLLLAAGSASSQQFLKWADSIRRIRNIPALGYAVFSSDKILDEGVAGFRKYKVRDSATLTDRFYVGTNTFAFTSYIAGRLVDQKKLNWNTTFTSLFPQYKSKLRPEFEGVDLKSLLSNRAGLAPYVAIEDYAHVPVFAGDSKNQRLEFANWVMQKPGLNAHRDKKVVESLAGYAVAAAMLEKVSGQDWETMVDEYINKPLGISAKFGWPNKIASNQPSGHWSKYGSLTAEPGDTWLKVYPPSMPGIDINISIQDYAIFLQENLKALRAEKSLLNQKTAELIHFGMNDYAFGWDNGAIGQNRISSHLGQSVLFYSYVELIPEKNLGVLVVCNNGDSAAKAGVINLCRLLRDYYLTNYPKK